MIDSAIFFAKHGYIFVAQDARGRYDSEGNFYPLVNEFTDGYDNNRMDWATGVV